VGVAKARGRFVAEVCGGGLEKSVQGTIQATVLKLLEMINFEQIRVFKTSVTRFEYISIVLQNMMDSFTPKVLLAGRKNG
jgi:hypothetical protein